MAQTRLNCASKKVMLQRVARLEEQLASVQARLDETENALAVLVAMEEYRRGQTEDLDLGGDVE